MNNDIQNFPFIKYPRALIDSPMFSDISVESRTLLALLLDRLGVSKLNSDRFTDKNGEIFVIFTIDEACRKLGCGRTKVLRLFRELEEYGMILRERNNRCKPYEIIITKYAFDILKQDLAKSQNETSRSHEIKPHEVSKSNPNYNNKNNNNYSYNQSSISGFERTEDEIREQIEYECIVCDKNRALLDEIVMIIFDVLNGTSPTVRVGKDDMPRGAVIARFCKLDSEHIYFVMSNIENPSVEVKNIKSYLITMLYNAPATIESRTIADFGYYNKIS